MVKVNAEAAGQNGAALEAAADIVGRRFGLKKVGPALVAKHAGLTTGAVYARYSSRDALAAAGIRAGFDRVILWMKSFPTSREYSESVRLDGADTRNDLWCPSMSYAAEISSASEAEKKAFRQGLEKMLNTMTEWPDLESRTDAIDLLSALAGEILYARALRHTAELDVTHVPIDHSN